MLERYLRQIVLPEIGMTGQSYLKQARILVIGAGGLGTAALYYLVAAGVGEVGVADFDVVELSNLQRQILFSEADVGKNKAEVATHRLKQLNSTIKIQIFPTKINGNNVAEIIKNYDLIMDCCDNFSTKYLLNDHCFQLKKPFLSASLLRFSAQVGFFHQVGCLRCVFPAENQMSIPTCQDRGMLGAVSGMIGSLQALEAIKYFIRLPSLLMGKLLCMDLLSYTTHFYQYSKDMHCALCAVED